uniref:Uncharacterized protein n=1 Tax=Arundo donax TaxID=35708 RepID=A0A0A9E5T0_ARUDO
MLTHQIFPSQIADLDIHCKGG